MMSIDPDKLVRILLGRRVTLMAYILSMVRDEQLAEDIFQDVCVITFQKQGVIQNEKHLLGWLRITARHESLKALRKRSTREPLLDSHLLDLLDSHWDQLDQTQSPEKILALRHCLDRLTANARHIVSLRYIDGLSGLKLAQTLGRKLNTVYVALARIHRTLASCIDQQLRSSEGAMDG